MTNHRSSSSNNGSSDNPSVVAELCRMVWMVFGPTGALFAAASLWKLPPWTYSTIDGVFWGFVFLSVVTKLVHVKKYHGMNTENTPSTMADFWGYTVKLFVLAVGLWFLVQSF